MKTSKSDKSNKRSKNNKRGKVSKIGKKVVVIRRQVKMKTSLVGEEIRRSKLIKKRLRKSDKKKNGSY